MDWPDGPRLEPFDPGNLDVVERHLRQVDSARMTAGTRLVLYWEGIVDGIERVELRGGSAFLRHLAFAPAREVVSRVYGPLIPDQHWRYEVIKEAGRGEVTIVERPMQENGFSLTVETNDGQAAGAARYRWFIVGQPMK